MAHLIAAASRAFAFMLMLGSAAQIGLAGAALDALDGKWTPGACENAGTWTVRGNQIQFFWPSDHSSDAVETVVREAEDVVETEVVSPDEMKGNRYRYSIVGDDVLIDNLSDGRQQVVHRCQ